MTKVLLENVAQERRENIKTSKDNFPVVGLEHITPMQVQLTDWSTDKDNTFTKVFKKGDILFGRRRAYLKKAALAPFDGICSGDITVISPIAEKIEPTLLPFIIQNDDFFDFAVEKSAGSLSPRVKWEHLKTYSFELPSMEKQRELAQILWAAEETKQAYKSLLQKTDNLVKAKFEEMFGNINKQPKYPTIELGKISNMISGGTPSSKHPEYFGGTIPFVSTPCLGPNYINATNAQNWLTELGIKNSTTHLIPAYSLLVGNRVGIGKCSINTCELCTNQDILSFTEIDTNKYNLLFIKKVIEQYEYVFNIQKRGATIKGIPSNLVKSALIPQAPITIQNKFVQFAQQSEQSKQQLQKSLEQLNATTKALINENLK